MAISLFTTDRLPIINGLAELPNVPINGIYLSQAIVYVDGGRAEDHDGVVLRQINGVCYAQFSDGISGDAVVSYFIG
jgi:hypothetical protein